MSEFGPVGKLPCDNLVEDYQYSAVNDWRTSNGGTLLRPAADMGKILEEVMEGCFKAGMLPVEMDAIYTRELNKALMRGEAAGEFDRAGVEDEMGDIITTVISACQKMSINTIAQMEKTLAKIKERKWSPNVDGILTRPK